MLVALEGRVRGRGPEPGGELPSRYEAGGAVRAYRRGEREFALGADDGDAPRRERRRVADRGGRARGPGRRQRLPRLPGTLAYWFAWQAFHPETLVDAAEPEQIEVEPLIF